MDDLDRLLAESLHGAAGHAPSDGGLLATVHERSRRYRRRRIVTGLSTVAAVLALGIPVATALVTRSQPVRPAQAPAPVSPSPSATASTSTIGTVRLVEGYSAPTFPYTLPPTAGMKAPVASMRDGERIAFFEATELRQHADTTVTVSDRKPVFTGAAAQTSMPVRGHAGTLRTRDTQPAKQLTLFWRESSTRWIQLATDDTYTPQQVVDLADSLTSASIAVLPPFTLDLTPAGLAADTVTASTMSFRTAKGRRVTVVLRKRRQLTGATETVGPDQAQLSRDPAGAHLLVDVSNWDATLDVSVDAGLTITDADLLRFAAGVHILNRSDPQ